MIVFLPLLLLAISPQILHSNLSVEMVAQGITFPTSMTFIDDDRALILEKNTGIVKLVNISSGHIQPVLDLNVAHQGERGLLGIASSVDNHVFIYFTESSTGKDEGSSLNHTLGNRLYRFEWIAANNSLVNPELLLSLPAAPGPNHNGGGIELFDGDVYLAIGNLNDKEIEYYHTKAENVDVDKLDGRAGIIKIDGSSQTTGARAQYYAYGIRNSFGLDFDPLTGRLWDTENGPSYGDEINLVNKHFNSGWKSVQGLSKPDAGIAGESNPDPYVTIGKYSVPEFIFNKTIGITELEFYNNSMFVGSVNDNGTLYRFDLDEDRNDIKSMEIFGRNFGGITDIETGPDGNLYILATKCDCLYRLLD